jgi:hypothetical protein
MADRWKWKSWRKDAKSKTVAVEWLESVDIFVETAFKARVKHLDGQPPQNWRRPFVDVLKGNCKPLVEIRFEVKNVQYRPLGYYSGKREFTIVYFATEVNGRFEPLSACEIALRRMSEIENDLTKVNEWWIEKRADEGNSNE